MASSREKSPGITESFIDVEDTFKTLEIRYLDDSLMKCNLKITYSLISPTVWNVLHSRVNKRGKVSQQKVNFKEKDTLSTSFSNLKAALGLKVLEEHLTKIFSDGRYKIDYEVVERLYGDKAKSLSAAEQSEVKNSKAVQPDEVASMAGPRQDNPGVTKVSYGKEGDNNTVEIQYVNDSHMNCSMKIKCLKDSRKWSAVRTITGDGIGPQDLYGNICEISTFDEEVKNYYDYGSKNLRLEASAHLGAILGLESLKNGLSKMFNKEGLIDINALKSLKIESFEAEKAKQKPRKPLMPNLRSMFSRSNAPASKEKKSNVAAVSSEELFAIVKHVNLYTNQGLTYLEIDYTDNDGFNRTVAISYTPEHPESWSVLVQEFAQDSRAFLRSSGHITKYDALFSSQPSPINSSKLEAFLTQNIFKKSKNKSYKVDYDAVKNFVAKSKPILEKRAAALQENVQDALDLEEKQTEASTQESDFNTTPRAIRAATIEEKKQQDIDKEESTADGIDSDEKESDPPRAIRTATIEEKQQSTSGGPGFDEKESATTTSSTSSSSEKALEVITYGTDFLDGNKNSCRLVIQYSPSDITTWKASVITTDSSGRREVSEFSVTTDDQMETYTALSRTLQPLNKEFSDSLIGLFNGNFEVDHSKISALIAKKQQKIALDRARFTYNYQERDFLIDKENYEEGKEKYEEGMAKIRKKREALLAGTIEEDKQSLSEEVNVSDKKHESKSEEKASVAYKKIKIRYINDKDQNCIVEIAYSPDFPRMWTATIRVAEHSKVKVSDLKDEKRIKIADDEYNKVVAEISTLSDVRSQAKGSINYGELDARLVRHVSNLYAGTGSVILNNHLKNMFEPDHSINTAFDAVKYKEEQSKALKDRADAADARYKNLKSGLYQPPVLLDEEEQQEQQLGFFGRLFEVRRRGSLGSVIWAASLLAIPALVAFTVLAVAGTAVLANPVALVLFVAVICPAFVYAAVYPGKVIDAIGAFFDRVMGLKDNTHEETHAGYRHNDFRIVGALLGLTAGTAVAVLCVVIVGVAMLSNPITLGILCALLTIGTLVGMYAGDVGAKLFSRKLKEEGTPAETLEKLEELRAREKQKRHNDRKKGEVHKHDGDIDPVMPHASHAIIDKELKHSQPENPEDGGRPAASLSEVVKDDESAKIVMESVEREDSGVDAVAEESPPKPKSFWSRFTG